MYSPFPEDICSPGSNIYLEKSVMAVAESFFSLLFILAFRLLLFYALHYCITNALMCWKRPRRNISPITLCHPLQMARFGVHFGPPV